MLKIEGKFTKNAIIFGFLPIFSLPSMFWTYKLKAEYIWQCFPQFVENGNIATPLPPKSSINVIEDVDFKLNWEFWVVGKIRGAPLKLSHDFGNIWLSVAKT